MSEQHARARRAAIRQAQQKVQLKPVYLDTETTGLDSRSEIVEICILDHDGRVLLDSLVQPLGDIPADASAVHGITTAMVQDAPTWAVLWPQIEAAMAARAVGIYNADYDTRLMEQSHNHHRLPWQPPATEFFCIMQLYAQFYGAWNSRYRSYRWQRLEQAAQQCGIELPNAHRAKADTTLARALLHHMAASDG